jgi:hypothetical protein
MSNQFTRPSFVTFTGVDDVTLIPGMQALAARFPIEWGILIDPDRDGEPLFPDRAVRRRLLETGLRFSAHVCGDAARDIANGFNPTLDLSGFARLQINHGRMGSISEEVGNCAAFGARNGVRPALQCQGPFPALQGVDWLFDASFGTGKRADRWPSLTSKIPFCGYSGGLGPDNVRDELAKIDTPGVAYWIDMESGVRTDGRFDIDKCLAVCEAVYLAQQTSNE